MASVLDKPVPPHVVIIGAGYAGSLLAKALQEPARLGKIYLTVVERREVMHHKIGSIRASVDASWSRRIAIPLSHIVKYGSIVTGNVSKVDSVSRTVLFDDPMIPDLHFDILVAATGAISRSPGDLPPHLKNGEEIAEYFKDMSSAIAEAKDITIVGGGASSIEFAGEIRHKYPDKPIKILSANTRLLASSVAPLSERFMTKLQHSLKAQNIEVISGARVERPSAQDFTERRYLKQVHVKAHHGDTTTLAFDTDLVIWAATFTVDSRIWPEEWMNEIGEMDVRDTFQIRNRNDVFAFGDVSSIAETKQAITLPQKVPLVAYNIMKCAEAIQKNQLSSRTHEDTKLSSKMKHYRVNSKATFYLPVGPLEGVSQTSTGLRALLSGGAAVYGGDKTRAFKGEDLFSNFFWELLANEKAPPSS